MMLPDSATIYGRLFLGAWDAGLDNVSDDTVSLMLHATEVPTKLPNHSRKYSLRLLMLVSVFG